MRSFFRHPTDIPLEVQPERQPAEQPTLRNVSHGGLCFRYSEPLVPGATVRVRIAVVSPPFEAPSRVVWCQSEGDAYQVGVEFLDRQDLYRARMIEQVCAIERYRHDEREKRGRRLSSHEAAAEWISRFARSFPGFGA